MSESKKPRGPRNEPNKNVTHKSRREVDTPKADDPMTRLEMRNRTLQGLHYSHNESRRFLQEMMGDVVEVLRSMKKED